MEGERGEGEATGESGVRVEEQREGRKGSEGR